MNTSEELAEKIKNITLEFWHRSSLPLLLSNLPRELSRDHPDYKAILAPHTLKQFVQETGPKFGYKLIEHPTYRAKIGILPLDSEYQFPDNHRAPNNSSAVSRTGERALVGFVRKLAELPPEDLEKVSIPASVLVKLLG